MKFEKHLKDISWGELESQVGSQVLQRGESYFKRGRVRNLAICLDGIIADVAGSDDYITLVSFSENSVDSELKLRCTCPYGFDCKHAVAVVLAYIDLIKNGKEIPETTSIDARLKQIKGSPSCYDFNDNSEGEDENFQEKFTKSNPSRDIAEFLEKFSKDALIEMILQLSSSNSELQQDLLDRSRLSSGKTEEMVSSIRKEIASIMLEPAWHSRKKPRKFTPKQIVPRNGLFILTI